MHVAVVGGSDAGIEAARRILTLDPSVEVSLLVADAFPNFSICGIPYYVSGEVPDWRDLATGRRLTWRPPGFGCCSITGSPRWDWIAGRCSSPPTETPT